MTAPEPTGGPARPARIAGIVLLVVAAIALVMGVVSLLPLGGGGSEAGGSTNNSTPAGTSSSTPAKTTTTSKAAPTTTTTAKPPATTTTNGQPTQQPPPANPAQTAQLRVYNNGTIKGMAQQAANDFTTAGWHVTTVSNYSQGIIATSTVYFRPGTDEEAAANALGQQFHLRVMPRFDGIQTADPGVIVIITDDYSPPRKG
ncbi:LytR C-terminal domain-containing protein [Kutzneria buriramensis]|uniref:LytR cell envelope-related transcriptional attenuator n=1 Tax=Kutzneria buriramensis TaxID=1045776 RepID=A0A3E0HWN4_9PSEU|nr:LytR C-terminal domain-containing protein [Kutzneria buriramensis]REH50355.1 LytR cell envelope-related transcriptional attenuator [Kutzneria buriramensis]